MKVLQIYFNTAARPCIPIGLVSLSNYIQAKGHAVEIFDTTFYKEFKTHKRDIIREKYGFYMEIENPVKLEYKDTFLTDDLKEKIEAFQPDIIGISMLSVHFHFSKIITRFVKNFFPSLPIIAGGLHPTLAPDETINESSVDMICIGEGEYSFAELLEKMESGEDITNIKGIWVKQGGKIYKNELGRLPNLSDLSQTDWDMFSDQHLYAPLHGRMHRVGHVEFSRGCPYSCGYCSINSLRDMYRPQKYLRRKPVDKAIEELASLKDKYNLEMFYFLDETFLSTDIKTLEVFAEEYKREVGIPFYGLTHPLSATEDKVNILKKMGCYLMTMGIECGNEEFRKTALNRKGTNQQITDAFQAFHKNGIYGSAFAMIGLPHETRDIAFDTVEMVRKCQPETISYGIYKPFIGSQLREICITEGFFDPSEDDYIYPDGVSVLEMPQFSKEEIEGLYKTFFLYTKVPKEKFPLVKQAERDDKLLGQLVEEYRDQPDN